MNNIYIDIENVIKKRLKSALCIVTETKGSTPRKAGSKMIVFTNGQILGTVGGGAIEKQVIDDAIKVIHTNSCIKKYYQLENDLSMHCGGNMEIFIEPLVQNNNLYIFGAGHVGKAVARFAKEFDFNITFFDWRDIEFTQDEIKDFTFIKGDYVESIGQANFDTDTYSVIVTPTHEYDELILSILGKKPFAYLGMIGSKRKVAGVIKNFTEKKLFNDEEISKFDMPIGIPFNVETPNEIALSIVAKLIDVKNSKNKI